jgi:hypothetical protein
LAKITQPTLVVNGREDIMIPTINSYNLAQQLPNAQLSIYADSGHGALFQFPELFVSQVARLVDNETWQSAEQAALRRGTRAGTVPRPRRRESGDRFLVAVPWLAGGVTFPVAISNAANSVLVPMADVVVAAPLGQPGQYRRGPIVCGERKRPVRWLACCYPHVGARADDDPCATACHATRDQ